ncbi:MAG: DUF4097 family beta strand repeat protein [Bacteriovorax sp.]|nr:DUF4097 family beta strand repeat protein [Bacteriovorax sp.]
MSLFLSLIFSLSLKTADAALAPVTFPAGGIKSLMVSVPKGRISISSSKTQKDISVNIIESNKIYSDNKKCLKSVGLENTQLVVKISSENILFEKADCNYDVMIVVPVAQTFDMDISSGSALVTVRNVSGTLNLKTATGSVSVDGDVVKNITAKSATGNMNFSYKTCSGRADLDFMSATGKMTLNLPAICKIRVDYKSATGKLFNALGETQDYQILINAKSASGDFTIGKI